jgi:hypothetical protein
MPLPSGGHAGDRPRARAERVATAPMSRERRQHAVAALAVLITAWQHDLSREPTQDPARRFPCAGRRATLTTPQDTPAIITAEPED